MARTRGINARPSEGGQEEGLMATPSVVLHITLDDPIVSITDELCRVAKGDSVVVLRSLVAYLCPKDMAGATAYVEMLQRLRSAAEAAMHTATEASAAVFNK